MKKLNVKRLIQAENMGNIHPEILRRSKIVLIRCSCGRRFKTTLGQKESGERLCCLCKLKKTRKDCGIRQISSKVIIE